MYNGRPVRPNRCILDEDLVRQLNKVVIGFSCFFVLYTVWTMQRIYVRWQFDKREDPDASFMRSLLMSLVFCKCSDTQMAVQLEEDQQPQNLIHATLQKFGYKNKSYSLMANYADV